MTISDGFQIQYEQLKIEDLWQIDGLNCHCIEFYYVMKSKDTPKSEKVMIASAIAYVIFPIDILSSKRLPIIGWLDEIVSLTVAYQRVTKYITPELEKKADIILLKWFPDQSPYIATV